MVARALAGSDTSGTVCRARPPEPGAGRQWVVHRGRRGSIRRHPQAGRVAVDRRGWGGQARCMTVLGITGASGGLGVSTLVCALGAATARAGLSGCVVDGEVFTGGLQVTAGVEHEPGYRWRDLGEVDGAVDGGRILARLPAAGGCAVLSAGRHTAAPEGLVEAVLPADAFRSVVSALDAVCDLVVVDWGRGDPVPGVAAADVVLAGLSPRGLADVVAFVARAGGTAYDGVITRSRRADASLAEALGARIRLPLLGQLADDRSVARCVVQGELPGQRARGPLSRLATTLVNAVTTSAPRVAAAAGVRTG